jgi:hypothetical protein
LQLEQRVLNEELVRERSIERHFGPVVQVTHPSRVAAFQFESDEPKPDFYQFKGQQKKKFLKNSLECV